MTMFNEKRLCFTFVMIKLQLVSLEVWGGLFLFEMNPGVSKFVFGIPYSTWIPFIFFTCDLRNQISASDGTKMWAESLQLARLGSRCMCLGF